MFLKKKIEHCKWVIMFSNDSSISFIGFSSKMVLGMEVRNGRNKRGVASSITIHCRKKFIGIICN